jgi:hypothetical protein
MLNECKLKNEYFNSTCTVGTTDCDIAASLVCPAGRCVCDGNSKWNGTDCTCPNNQYFDGYTCGNNLRNAKYFF